jgi:NADP-dependent 3-hydroxy acid dehydrogenase YdfG
MLSLAGKTAIVTGASSGIGLATAQAFAALGARVAVGARRAERLPQGDAFVPLPLDVLDKESCATFVDRAVAELGGLDILFNNAGLALGRDPFDKSSEEDERLVIETNVLSVMRLTRLCLPHIRDNGHLVFIGSVAGRVAYPNGATYIASKFAVRGLTYALREDLLGRPIDPLTPEDIADIIAFTVTRPPHVNIDEVVVKALAQSSGARFVRRES